METPGQRLRQFRKQANLQQEALAELIGVSTPTISRWELDQAHLPKMGAMALQLASGLRWEWLMTGEGPKRVEGALPSAHELAAFVGSLFDLADHLSSLGRQLRTAASRVERKP